MKEKSFTLFILKQVQSRKCGFESADNLFLPVIIIIFWQKHGEQIIEWLETTDLKAQKLQKLVYIFKVYLPRYI